MLTINKNQTMLHESGAGVFSLSAEASEIGLRPGEWPQFIAVLDDAARGFLFQRGSQLPNGDDLGGYRYSTKTGVELVVFND